MCGKKGDHKGIRNPYGILGAYFHRCTRSNKEIFGFAVANVREFSFFHCSYEWEQDNLQ